VTVDDQFVVRFEYVENADRITEIICVLFDGAFLVAQRKPVTQDFLICIGKRINSDLVVAFPDRMIVFVAGDVVNLKNWHFPTD